MSERPYKEMIAFHQLMLVSKQLKVLTDYADICPRKPETCITHVSDIKQLQAAIEHTLLLMNTPEET